MKKYKFVAATLLNWKFVDEEERAIDVNSKTAFLQCSAVLVVHARPLPLDPNRGMRTLCEIKIQDPLRCYPLKLPDNLDLNYIDEMIGRDKFLPVSGEWQAACDAVEILKTTLIAELNNMKSSGEQQLRVARKVLKQLERSVLMRPLYKTDILHDTKEETRSEELKQLLDELDRKTRDTSLLRLRGRSPEEFKKNVAANIQTQIRTIHALDYDILPIDASAARGYARGQELQRRSKKDLYYHDKYIAPERVYTGTEAQIAAFSQTMDEGAKKYLFGNDDGVGMSAILIVMKLEREARRLLTRGLKEDFMTTGFHPDGLENDTYFCCADLVLDEMGLLKGPAERVKENTREVYNALCRLGKSRARGLKKMTPYDLNGVDTDDGEVGLFDIVPFRKKDLKSQNDETLDLDETAPTAIIRSVTRKTEVWRFSRFNAALRLPLTFKTKEAQKHRINTAFIPYLFKLLPIKAAGSLAKSCYWIQENLNLQRDQHETAARKNGGKTPAQTVFNGKISELRLPRGERHEFRTAKGREQLLLALQNALHNSEIKIEYTARGFSAVRVEEVKEYPKPKTGTKKKTQKKNTKGTAQKQSETRTA